MRNIKITALAVAGGLFLSGQLHADTYLSIGSNPVGNTAYQWAAGISEVVNKNVKGVNAAAEGTKGYVANVQRKEIREGIACVKHQNMSGSDMGDDHKEYFAGDAALKASGKDNTMNQF